MVLRDIKAGAVLFLVLAVVTGIVYPLAMTGIGQAVFPYQANGSLVRVHGKVVGSALLGQYFRGKDVFWSRPSATSPMPYNAESSSASNLGPNNPVLLQHVKARVAAIQKANPGEKGPVPVDLVTSSASGLDPDISVAAAHYQLARVARNTGLSPTRLKGLIKRYTTPGFFGFGGDPVVNVLKLNLAVLRLKHSQ